MDPKEALKRVQNICSKQEKCRRDIHEKLISWNLPDKEINTFIASLEKEGFIDEQRYAESFVRDKLRINKWGKRKIEYLLKQKHIPEHMISTSLDQIRNDEYKELLHTEIMKKLKSLRTTNSYEKKRKLIQFAQQRGFEYEVIYQVLDKIDL